MKYILLIGDGMGDAPVAVLGNKTPLEVAATPSMDELCRQGELLMTRTVPQGYPPGSDVANLSLLGYQPDQVYTGRAPLEAASMGVELGSDQVAFRCNLVHAQRDEAGRMIMVDYSAGHISTQEGQELISALQRACGTDHLAFYPGVSYRHLLVFGGELPANFVTVAPHDYSDRDVSSYFLAYAGIEGFAAMLAEAEAVLAKHPVNVKRLQAGKRSANSIWLWGEGKRPAMPTLQALYGLSGVMISAVDLLKGIGVLSGLQKIEVPGATGYLDTNYEGKVAAALEGLRDHDLAVVHVEAPDETGHQGLVREKVRAIEDFDRHIVAPIVGEMQRRRQDFRLVATMDHFTPLHLRTHVDWPVPMLLYDSRAVAHPSGLAYTEENARQAQQAGKATLFASGGDFFRHFIQHPNKS